MPFKFFVTGILGLASSQLKAQDEFTVNVTTSQDIANRQAKTLGEGVGVENVTDEEYASVGWYSLYEPGSPRLFTASVEYKFQ